MIDYLKARMTELESKLRESQEKGLAFAYELKGREEARKESRREMEEFLAAVKRQQAESETERSRGLELEKARARIEALELKIMEFSAPRPEPPGPQETQLRAAEMEKLRAASRGDLTEEFKLLGAKLAEKILKETMEPLAARLAVESAAREKDLRDMRQLADNMADKVSRLENAFSKKLADMETLLAGFSLSFKAAQEAAREAAGRENAGDIRALAAAAFERISGLQAGMGAEFRKMASAMEDFRSGLRDCQVAMESSRKDVFGIVEGLKRALVAGGAQGAADSAAGRLVSDSAPYELGFITACFDNLDSAARDLGSALEVFRGTRQEALKPIKKILGA